MTRKGRSRAIIGVVFGVTFAFWSATGVALQGFMTHQSNLARLEELSAQLMRRIEKTVDFVVIASTDILTSNVSGCGSATQKYLRNLALDTANTPNIFLISQDFQCVSFENYDVALPADDVRAGWAVGRNPDFRFGPIEGPRGKLLGVSWGYGTDLELVVALDLAAQLFDVLQFELRSGGYVSLRTDRDVIAEFFGDEAAMSDRPAWRTFAATGERYPLQSEIQIDPNVLATWRRDVPSLVVALWSAFGVLVAGLAVAAVTRRRDASLDAVLDALDNQEIVPHFQPIVDVNTGAVVGCEALARWIKPSGETVPPGKFIPILERSGHNHLLLEALLRQAADSLRYALDEHRGFYIGFNATPEEFESPDFADTLLSLSRLHRLRPDQICIEITERQAANSQSIVADTVDRLSSSGFRIAIDDAGTGHNGLSALQTLKATTLKIDKFFVDQIPDEPRAKVMIEMFVSVARQYGMKTIAEGVETAAQANALKLAGIDAIQGYYYSRPVPAKEFLVALDSIWEGSSRLINNSTATEVEDVTRRTA
ncbi:EAL domain-containing protein [Cognatiyoonia sp. IB215182]|uniref:EAL domain-containing protein n=1 Tax=Cognatiyoonia sp. IB215182 TaxID=3097353 RepID=UPI002A0E3A81|nr:EAL domain-containing protein [Cognatiyoonia sp. IB215182]MDX8351651.1 EAL domain-containing protein [Cognatiyoonia sp. IB215182]